MADREDIDHFFGDPSFEGSEHPLARDPEDRLGVARRDVGTFPRPAPLKPRNGVPHCGRCWGYHQPHEECLR